MSSKKSTDAMENQHQQGDEDKAHVHGPSCNHGSDALKPITRQNTKIGRNDPCNCGSNKKFKKCCGA